MAFYERGADTARCMSVSSVSTASRYHGTWMTTSDGPLCFRATRIRSQILSRDNVGAAVVGSESGFGAVREGAQPVESDVADGRRRAITRRSGLTFDRRNDCCG